MAPALETTKTAGKVKKSDIPITQIGGKVKVVARARGSEINATMRPNALLTCRLVVF